MGNNAKTTDVLIPILSACLLLNCTASRQTARTHLELNNDFCVLVSPRLMEDTASMPSWSDAQLSSDTLLRRQLSQKEILIANSLGLTSLIVQWLQESAHPAGEDRTRLLMINAAFQQRIMLARAGIDAIAAGLHCEAERIRRIAGYLDDKEKKRSNRMTIGAILAGTITTIAPIIIKNQGLQNGIIIGGGAISTFLGIEVLRSGKKTVEFTYQKNLLSDIWYGSKKSTVCPGFIWYMLTRPEFNPVDPTISIQQNIKKRWLHIEFGQAVDQHQQDLFFNQGGVFTEDELTILATLLDQLNAAVLLLNTQIEILLLATGRMG